VDGDGICDRNADGALLGDDEAGDLLVVAVVLPLGAAFGEIGNALLVA
jgi:hypothetical protein